MALVPRFLWQLDRPHPDLYACNSPYKGSRLSPASTSSNLYAGCSRLPYFTRRFVALSIQSDSGRGTRAESSASRRSSIHTIVQKLKKHSDLDEIGDGKEGTAWSLNDGKETGKAFVGNEDTRFPWEKTSFEEENGEERWTASSRSRTYLAELTLPDYELRRLRNMTFQVKTRVKVKGSGVTDEVIAAIREKWNTSELARVKIEGTLALNMKKMHEILERKTGGLVVWRSGSSLSLYRGVSYLVPQQSNQRRNPRNAANRSLQANINPSPLIFNEREYDRERYSSVSEVNYEEEVDKLLDELGPRYTDWSGSDPLPVDADMLPGVVHDFKPPYRVLPYGVRRSLSQKDATSIRRLAKSLPPHFALGRNRQLQGLAVAMIKLWEKTSIAKIALKRGVHNTASERMAEDIKNLTGGLLLSRNKDFLVFYRGKDFLSQELCDVLVEREALAKSFQDEEEQARLRGSSVVIPKIEPNHLITGTLEETLNANSRWGNNLDEEHVTREAAHARHVSVLKRLERKLEFAQKRILKAEAALSKVETFLEPTETQANPNSISEEERYMFRKLGLRMKAFLLLGRRGVFDGTVENMHLHWKYRELVKIVLKAKTFEHVKRIALALEAESGGVLVSVDKVSKGYAIVVYRGREYQRPLTIRPKNLLTKRKALARSIEIQRREALLKFVTSLQTKIASLTSNIVEMRSETNEENSEILDRIDALYRTDDEESEEEMNNEGNVEKMNLLFKTDGEDTEVDEDGVYDKSDEAS